MDPIHEDAIAGDDVFHSWSISFFDFAPKGVGSQEASYAHANVHYREVRWCPPIDSFIRLEGDLTVR